MPKRAATVKLDDEVLDAVRRQAERSGRCEDQVVEAAVRRYVGPSVLDRLRGRHGLDEDEGMVITVEEVAAHRESTRLTAAAHRHYHLCAAVLCPPTGADAADRPRTPAGRAQSWPAAARGGTEGPRGGTTPRSSASTASVARSSAGGVRRGRAPPVRSWGAQGGMTTHGLAVASAGRRSRGGGHGR